MYEFKSYRYPNNSISLAVSDRMYINIAFIKKYKNCSQYSLNLLSMDNYRRYHPEKDIRIVGVDNVGC
jgi:hypothetical protein